MDTVYKMIVVAGGIALAYMNATYAKRDDIRDIQKSLEEIKSDVRVINSNFTHIEQRVGELSTIERALVERMRAMERRP